MRIRRMLLVVALLLASAPVAAQLREGVYTLAGRTPEGETYDGAVTLRPGPAGSWLMQWQVGNTRLIGVGLAHAGVLAIAFQVNGNPGVAAYDVDAAGRLRGTWTTGAGLGSELLTPR
jgi:hypothetical protein